jgi:hypothetical protein
MKKVFFVLIGAFALGACENRSTDSAAEHRPGTETGTSYGTGTGTNEGRSVGDPAMQTDTLRGAADGTGTQGGTGTGTGAGDTGTGTQGTGSGGTGTGTRR